ncbi:MAG: hypothetical protein GX275_02890 [Clostridiales bacterium]|nr:hypothetical protein [Clostridiales bacterium]
MYKKIILLISTLGILTTFLTGCGCNRAAQDTKNTAENVKDAAKEGAENVKEGAVGLYDKVTDKTMDYEAQSLIKSLEDEGYKLKEDVDSDSYFSVAGKKYKINDDELRIYEYATTAASDLEKDFNTIGENAGTINNKEVKWNKEAHLYKKGRIVVIYDGEDSKILTSLKNYLGDPIVG